MEKKRFISVILIFVLMTEIVLGASSAYGMEMSMKEEVIKEIDAASQEAAVEELSRMLNEYLEDESSSLELVEENIDIAENQDNDNYKEYTDIPGEDYDDMQVSSLWNYFNAPSEFSEISSTEEDNKENQSTFTLSGYVAPDFTATSAVNSGFKVEILGTEYSTETNEEGFFIISGRVESQERYILQITKSSFLKRQIDDLTLGGIVNVGTKGQPIKMWAGDIPKNSVQDDTINMSDVIQIAINFNKLAQNDDFNEDCDLNDDGSINMADVIIMARHFNATTSSYGIVEVDYFQDFIKPSKPRNLKSLWYTGSSISLKWSPSYDDMLDRYEVYCNDKLIGTTKKTEIICTGLTPNAENKIYVIAIDTSGNMSDASDILSIFSLEDDHGDTMDKSTPIELEKEISGRMDTWEDEEYFCFTPQKSGYYLFMRYDDTATYNSRFLDNTGAGISLTDSGYFFEAGKKYYLNLKNGYLNYDYRFVIRSANPKVDLVVNNVYPQKAYVGDPVELEVSIANIGDIYCNSNFRIMVDINEKEYCYWVDYNSGLTKDSSKRIKVTGGISGKELWTPYVAGKHSIKIHIDYDNSVDEIYENNNTFEFQLYVDETNDTFDTAKQIKLGEEIEGRIINNCTKDYYYFIPEQTGEYQFIMPSPKDICFYIYNKNRKQVVATGVGNDYIVTYNFNAGEMYYISVIKNEKVLNVDERYKIKSYPVLPDLVIEGMSKLSYKINDYKPNIVVQNIGLKASDADNTFRIKIEVKETNKIYYTEYSSRTIDSKDKILIPIDDSLYEDIIGKKNIYSVKLSIDKKGPFIESDESNNSLETIINIESPELKVSEIVMPYDSLVNHPLDLKVKITNCGYGDTAGSMPIKVGLTLNGSTYYSDDYLGKIKTNETITLAVYDSTKNQPVVSSIGVYDMRAYIIATDKYDDGLEENNSLYGKLDVDKVPDLAVTNIHIEPTNINVGDSVRISADVKNIGEGKIANNKAIRVGFKIDETTVLWSDTFTSGLKPGEKVTLKCNSGIIGDYWYAEEGEYTVAAIVDDLDQFTELDESNNIMFKNLKVQGKCDLSIEDIILEPANPAVGEQVVLKARIRNTSDYASPFGRINKVGFRINYGEIIWADPYKGSIDSGGYVVVSTDEGNSPYFWTPTNEGEYIISAYVDYDNYINEIDETNNEKDKTIRVTSISIFDEEDDYDNDGLKNGEEIKIGTDWNNFDTDGDSISDGDEVTGKNGFITDPLNPDTDEDGVFDNAEIALGKSPISKDEYSYYSIKAQTQSESVTVEVYGSGGLEACPIKVNELDNFMFSSIDGVIGNPVEISLEGYTMQEASISFNYNEINLDGISEDELTVYQVDYENKVLVPLPDYRVSVDKYNNIITARVNHFSTYVPGRKNDCEISFKKETVFSIDESGSMLGSDSINLRIGIPKKVLEDIDYDNSVFAVVKFSDEVKRLIDLTNDKESIINALDMAIGGGLTDIKGGLEESERILINSKNRKYVILLSDGDNNCYSNNEVINVAKRMAKENIKVLCVSLGKRSDLLYQIASITNGSYFILNTSLKGVDLENEINDIAEKLKDIIESEEDFPKEKKGPAKKIVSKETYGCINWAGDIDAYEFTPDETKLYCISSMGETDTEINIYDSKGKLISSSDSNDDNEWDKNFYILMNLTKGQKYRFEVNHSDLLNGIGEYKICVDDPVKEKLSPGQSYLKLLVYEMEGTYTENLINKSVDVTIDGETRTFNKISFVNGEVVVDVQDFLDAFGIFEMYAAPNTKDTEPRISTEDMKKTLSGLGCGNIVTLNMESVEIIGKATKRAIETFQKKFMGRQENFFPIDISGTYKEVKLDDETNKELLEYNRIRKINPAFLKSSGVSVRAYLETVYNMTSANGFTLSYDGKNIIIYKNTAKRAETFFIPELDYRGGEKRCYAKIRNIKIAYENYLNDNYGSQDVYDTKVNMLKLMGKAMKSGHKFEATDIKNSMGIIDAYWDDKFEKAVNNYVKAAFFTDVYNALCNGKYGKYGNLKNNDVKALFLKHWTDIEIQRSPSFAEYPAPVKWYSMIPDAPTKDNGKLIDKYNKESSVSAKEYYDSYYLPMDKIRNWQGSNVGLRRVWLQATYGVTGDEMGGILGGALSALKDYPETVKEIFTSIWAMLKNPKNTLDTVSFLCKVLWPVGFSEEKEMFINALKDMVTAFIEEFKNADSYGKGKKIGEAIIFVSSFFVSGTGIVKSLKVLDVLKKNKVISQVYSKVAKKSIASKEALAKTLNKMAEGVELLKTYLNTKLDSVFEIVQETKDLGTKIRFKLRKEKVDVEIDIDKKDLTPGQCSYSLTGCFTGDTLVTTKTGLKRIDEITKGEFVLAKDVKTGEIDYKQVIYVYKKETKKFVRISTGNGIINTTPGHLFFTDIGWWVAAENLKAGDKVVTASGEMTDIVSVEPYETAEPVSIYNLNVDEYHTYFVGNSRLLVHNDCTAEMMAAGREAISAARLRGLTNSDELAKIAESSANAVEQAIAKGITDPAELARIGRVAGEAAESLKYFTPNALTHIFEGEIKGAKSVGWHYEPSSTTGRIVSIVQPPNTQGVYEAVVEIGGVLKTNTSTFFPKTWSKDEVMSAIYEAYRNANPKIKADGTEFVYKWTGTSRGITIDMFLDANAEIISAFPKM